MEPPSHSIHQRWKAVEGGVFHNMHDDRVVVVVGVIRKNDDLRKRERVMKKSPCVNIQTV